MQDIYEKKKFLKKRPNEKFNRKAKNGKDKKKKHKKVKKTGAPLSTDRVWVTAQLEANRLKQEEETGNEARSAQHKSDANDAPKDSFGSQNQRYDNPLLPKDE